MVNYDMLFEEFFNKNFISLSSKLFNHQNDINSQVIKEEAQSKSY